MTARRASRRSVLTWAVAAVAAGAACEKLDAAADPVWGKEPCAHCAMLVGDRRYAAQAVTSGERKFFDDVGCFVLWSEERPGRAQKAWVRDAVGTGWVEATSARYAKAARTPMDFGFEGRAVAGADPTVGWEEMRATVLARVKTDRSERNEK